MATAVRRAGAASLLMRFGVHRTVDAIEYLLLINSHADGATVNKHTQKIGKCGAASAAVRLVYAFLSINEPNPIVIGINAAWSWPQINAMTISTGMSIPGLYALFDCPRWRIPVEVSTY